MPQLCRHPRHPVIGSFARRRAPGIRIERVDLCARRRRNRRHDGRDPAGDHRGGRQAAIHAGYRGRPPHLQGRPRHPQSRAFRREIGPARPIPRAAQGRLRADGVNRPGGRRGHRKAPQRLPERPIPTGKESERRTIPRLTRPVAGEAILSRKRMQVAGPRRPSAVVDGGGAHDTPARGVLRHTQRRVQPPRQRSQERLAEATAGRTREGRRRRRVHGW
mmetsp:Transcript_11100/g.31034  ORF Transcript_11100/g.31034 Transcript_11100/m.31034 type:complete len:219 (+) Transcript_11100:296-952(+)